MDDELENVKLDMVSRILSETRQRVLEDLILLIADKAGVEQIEGLSLRDFLHQRHCALIEKMMISLGDKNPAVAAILQEHIDKGS